MSESRLLLVRHGQTEWSRERKHTGRTDIPLDPDGERQAQTLAGRLPIDEGAKVWVSPLRRAVDTAHLAGLPIDELVPELIEWDYGTVEGRTTAELREETPGWDVWTHGIPNGETVYEVGGRADQVILRAREAGGTIVLVSHAHFLRIFAARWIGLPPTAGKHLLLDPAAWCLLGWERENPAIVRWNVRVT